MAKRDILGVAHDFRISHLQGRAQLREESRSQAVDALRAAARVDLLAFETATEYGGHGASFGTKQGICEELSRADMAFTFALINTQNIAAKLAQAPGAANRNQLIKALMAAEIFGATALSEPGAGSDFAAIKTMATKNDDGWLLNGTKGWISNVAIADIFIVYVQTDPGAGWRGIAAFLVDGRKTGFRRGDIYQLIGGHAIGAGEFHLENYQAGNEDMLFPPGVAFKQAMDLINGARAYVASMCCGMIADALERALDYGEERTAFGQPILNNQGLMWSLVDVASDLEALRAVSEKAGGLIDRGEDAVMAAAVAKKMAGEVTVPAIAACIQAMGANGLKRDHNLGHHLACAKIAAFTDGSTEMMKERIAATIRARRL